jgi:hemerythrin-like domain-containing protein
MSIFEQLEEEHYQLRDLMRRVAKTSNDNPKKRMELFEQLKEDYLAHSKGEDETFYSELEDHEQIYELIEDSREDHAIAEDLIRKLSRLDYTDQQWMVLFKSLRESIDDHIEREEDEVFPQARDIMDDESADSMGDQFTESEKRFRSEYREAS